MGTCAGFEGGRSAGGDCTRPVKAKGLCAVCYKRKLRADGRVGTQRGNGHWGKWRGVESTAAGDVYSQGNLAIFQASCEPVAGR